MTAVFSCNTTKRVLAIKILLSLEHHIKRETLEHLSSSDLYVLLHHRGYVWHGKAAAWVLELPRVLERLEKFTIE